MSEADGSAGPVSGPREGAHGASGEDENDPLVGTILAERFKIVTRLGVGGMGSVYRAEHVHMRKPVAVKVLHREMTALPEVVARFEREAIAAGRIDHPNVAAATDFGRLDDGSFYLVLEYVEGTDLADQLNLGPVLPEARAVHITMQIAEALAAAHAAGIVHRDLKPENVMLIERPGEPDFVKVLDFGIAKVALEGTGGNEQLTKLGTVFGTPQYMSPEQAAGEAVDFRADIYTVGILLFEMLTAQAPFDDEDMVRVLSMQIDDPPPPLPDWVDPEVVEIVAQLLAKKPEDRPESATAVAERLAAILERLGGPPLPMPPEQARQMLESYTGAGIQPPPAAVPARESQPRTVGIGRVHMPVWGLVLGAILLVAAAAAATSFAVLRLQGDPQPTPSAVATGTTTDGVEPSPPKNVLANPKDEELAARASTGDEEAIKEIEARPDKGRTAALWFALGRGRMVLEEYTKALDAYGRAIDLDAALAADQSLLRDVRRAARKKDSANDAIAISAKKLGPGGADILYDVWVATRAKTPATQLARELVYSEDIRKQASPALNVVLDLREAETCDDMKELLARVTLNGDTRTLRVLRPLTEKYGCGERKKEDCWPCLRDDDALDEAIKAVRARPSPQFL